MQFSLAQQAADDFVSFVGDPHRSLEDFLGEELAQEELEQAELPEHISDWLHIWLLSGRAHRACRGDVTVYMNAVALVFAEFSMSKLLDWLKPAPPTPRAIVTPVTEDDAAFITAPEFLLPASLTPDGFEGSQQPSKNARRRETLAFVKHPERSRYGFNTYGYYPEQ